MRPFEGQLVAGGRMQGRGDQDGVVGHRPQPESGSGDVIPGGSHVILHPVLGSSGQIPIGRGPGVKSRVPGKGGNGGINSRSADIHRVHHPGKVIRHSEGGGIIAGSGGSKMESQVKELPGIQVPGQGRHSGEAVLGGICQGDGTDEQGTCPAVADPERSAGGGSESNRAEIYACRREGKSGLDSRVIQPQTGIGHRSSQVTVISAGGQMPPLCLGPSSSIQAMLICMILL